MRSADPPSPPVRILTCGSVDDGKSTLIGRLLVDAGLVPDDQREEARRASAAAGHQDIDFSLLLDGLLAERDQGITIDVAYRYVTLAGRRFVLADTPGHEQYTRNMVTAASDSDAAILLVDATKGLLTQTHRHATILSVMGVQRVALIVNKLDLVGYARDAFAAIEEAFRHVAERLSLSPVAIPVCARSGVNVARRASETSWYEGPTLLEWIKGSVREGRRDRPLRLPVQTIIRAEGDFRACAGPLASGTLKVGDVVAVARSGRRTRVERLVAMSGDPDRAEAGDAVTAVLSENIDVGRGDILCGVDEPAIMADQFAADIVWFNPAPMLPHRSYFMRIGTDMVTAEISAVKYKLSLTSLEHIAAKDLHENEIARCNISASRPVGFDPYGDNRQTGGFILIDRLTRQTVGAGMVRFALRRASNIVEHRFELDRRARATRLGQQPAIIWLTGLSGAGKSTLANRLEQELADRGYLTYILDGDNIRQGLCRDLGFTDSDRVENIRRVAETARLLADAGLIVFVSLISPFQRERQMAREIAQDIPFVETYVEAPLSVCEERDPKKLYFKARAGEISNFTGISSPYEAPETPDILVSTSSGSVEESTQQVLGELDRLGIASLAGRGV